MRSILEPTTESHHHPRPEGGAGRAWLWAVKGAVVRRGLCDRSCALRWRHTAVPQWPSRSSSGEVPFLHLPVVLRDPNTTRHPRAKAGPRHGAGQRKVQRASRGKQETPSPGSEHPAMEHDFINCDTATLWIITQLFCKQITQASWTGV